MIKWTAEMIEELKQVKNVMDFCRKYNISNVSAYSKRKEILGLSTKKKTNDIISNEAELIENGLEGYINIIEDKLLKSNGSLQDIYHYLEGIDHEKITEEQSLSLVKFISSERKIRRVYKNELSFLKENKELVPSYIQFMKNRAKATVNNSTSYYNTKQLTAQLGSVFVSDNVKENSETISELKRNIDRLEKGYDAVDAYVNRLLSLEKMRIKQERKTKRENNQLVVIDQLKNNWKDLFNALQDKDRLSILKEVYDMTRKSTGFTDKTLIDFLVWQESLPIYLYRHNMFIK